MRIYIYCIISMTLSALLSNSNTSNMAADCFSSMWYTVMVFYVTPYMTASFRPFCMMAGSVMFAVMHQGSCVLVQCIVDNIRFSFTSF